MAELIVRVLGQRAYEPTWSAMKAFTQDRDDTMPDEIWLVQHPPVFTQGLNGKLEHLLNPGEIPVVQTDRGGQVTYHGPGQWILYPLLDLKRAGLDTRHFVHSLERGLIDYLSTLSIDAHAREDAPGVYVGDAKLASLGLKVTRKGCYHGIALNVDMDLSPFARINPCGLTRQPMTQLADLVTPLPESDALLHDWVACTLAASGYKPERMTWVDEAENKTPATRAGAR